MAPIRGIKFSKNEMIKYNVEFSDGAKRFKEFQKAYSHGKLYASKETKDGIITYNYKDGLTRINGQCVKNRRSALINLFSIDETNTVSIYNRRHFFTPPVSKTITATEPGSGVVAFSDGVWFEVTQITASELADKDGMPFKPNCRSTIAEPGYIPTIISTLNIISPQDHLGAFTKINAQDGEMIVCVNPSNFRVFKYRRGGHKAFGISRLSGITEPLGAMCSAQLSKLVFGSI